MSTIKADNIATLAGVSTSMANAVNGSAKAWVNFNGTGTVAIRGSYNVSSITDIGTGDYRVNFTTAMPDANYAKVISNAQNSAFAPQTYFVDYARGTNNYAAPTTTSFSMAHMRASDGLAVDTAYINVAVFSN